MTFYAIIIVTLLGASHDSELMLELPFNILIKEKNKKNILN